MSNDKLAEALRAFPEDPNPFTYRRCYAKAQEALRAHAAEATLCKHGELLGSDGCEKCSDEAAQAQSVPGELAEPIEGAFNYEQKLAFTEGWNACRDAMLAAAPQQAAEPKGWMASDNTGRVIDAKAKTAGSRAAATASATAMCSIPPYTHPTLSDAERLADALREIKERMEDQQLTPLVAAIIHKCDEALAAHSAQAQPAQDAKLTSGEDFRLHLGELTSAELRGAQAACRFAAAKESGR